MMEVAVLLILRCKSQNIGGDNREVLNAYYVLLWNDVPQLESLSIKFS